MPAAADARRAGRVEPMPAQEPSRATKVTFSRTRASRSVSQGSRRRNRRRRVGFIARVAVLAVIGGLLPALSLALARPASAAASCPSGGCSVTVDARDLTSGSPLARFSYIVNVDNTKL
ncbi:MAG: hypothetical protein QOK11_954, partial [Pseudonocardiales bacterium]|nr:hypothetical protein [Pseudonocardiales bacterium]